MSILAQPQQAVSSVALMAESVDHIVWEAGFRGTQWDWYRVRLSVGAVYAATELYLLSDASPGFKSSWDFLRRMLRVQQAWL
jgi:ubiquinone biosynthesis protein COQ9